MYSLLFIASLAFLVSAQHDTSHCGKKMLCLPSHDCADTKKHVSPITKKERDFWFNHAAYKKLAPTAGGYPVGWKCFRCRHRPENPTAKRDPSKPRRSHEELNKVLADKIKPAGCTFVKKERDPTKVHKPGHKMRMFRKVGVIIDEKHKIFIRWARRRRNKPAGAAGTPAGPLGPVPAGGAPIPSGVTPLPAGGVPSGGAPTGGAPAADPAAAAPAPIPA